MRKEMVLAGVCAVLVALLCSCFVGTVMATTEKAVLFSDSFSDDTVDDSAWDATTAADLNLYGISDDNELEVSAYDADPAFGEHNLYTIDGYDNNSLSFAFTMEKISNAVDVNDTRNDTFMWGAITDLSLTDDADSLYGMIAAVVMEYDANGDYIDLSIYAKETDWEELDDLSWQESMEDVTVDTIYSVVMTVDKDNTMLTVSIVDTETDAALGITMTDLYDIDADTELGLAFGGSIGYPEDGIGGFAMPNPILPFGNFQNEPLVAANTAVGYVDDVEISTQVTAVTPVIPPVTIRDRSVEIAWWFVIIGALWLLGTGLIWTPLKEKNLQWLMTLIGIVWLVAGILNYYFGWIKTIPYLAQ